jgi:hypothetical protein
MKLNKKRNGSGELTFTLKISFHVSKSRLILALTDNYYRKKIDAGIDLDEQLSNLTRKDAIVMLYNEVHHFGMQGEHFPGFFEAATDVAPIRDETYTRCAQWVCDKFPELNK